MLFELSRIIRVEDKLKNDVRFKLLSTHANVNYNTCTANIPQHAFSYHAFHFGLILSHSYVCKELEISILSA
jgi:hypothetical protein